MELFLWLQHQLEGTTKGELEVKSDLKNQSSFNNFQENRKLVITKKFSVDKIFKKRINLPKFFFKHKKFSSTKKFFSKKKVSPAQKKIKTGFADQKKFLPVKNFLFKKQKFRQKSK